MGTKIKNRPKWRSVKHISRPSDVVSIYEEKDNMKKLSTEQRVRILEKQLADLQAYCGVLSDVFEREYRKGKYDFSKK